ncbi:alkaline phosphatase [Paraconexibacter sp.]|uniref:alkaline phosphatase D family protein n=1 Tax=Paraconexibacter sp. TaxID=2949640 RepID=UPI003563A1BC
MTDYLQPVTRRAVVGGALATGGAVLLGGPAALGATKKRPRRKIKEPFLRDGEFNLGVGSGLPGTDEITLWTRVDGVERNSRIRLEIARDPDFKKTVLRRNVRVPEIRDWTVHTRVKGGPLKPGEEYYYRFETRKTSSEVGRFRTARPADSNEPVRIGYFSCQDYQAGYYGAHGALAEQDDLDLVVCLGDYVYEQTFYPGPDDRKDRLGKEKDGFVLTLPEWREKYRLYKADPNLRALHAAHPFIAVWDDHEVEDNYAADKRDPAKSDDVDYDIKDRRRNGYLAFFEYMPRLRTKPVDTRIYGSARFGKTAEVFLLDQRQYRDQQACGGELLVPCPDAETGDRTYLGAAQKQWFKDAVSESQARWKVVANQLMIMAVDSAPGVTINVDAWDGYGAERREILEHFRSKGVKDLTFITGDIHTFFAGTVHTNGRASTPAVGTEFVGGSITSLGFEHIITDATAREGIRQGLRVSSPHITYAELQSRGFGVLEARTDGLKVDYMTVDALDPKAKAKRLASFSVAPGSTEVVKTA